MAEQVFGQATQTGLNDHNYLVVESDGSININQSPTIPLSVRENSFVDTGNSSSEQLIADEVFTGTPVEILQYGVVSVAVYSDVVSATDGLRIEQSVDGVTDWHWVDVYTIPALDGKSYQVQPAGDYLRVVYTNGSAPTTGFHIHVVLHPDYIRPSSHRIQDSIVNDDDAELVKAVLTGENGTGTFKNVKVNPDGNLYTVDRGNGLSIAKGEVTGSDFIHKFGEAPDIDATDNEVTVWDGANNGLFGGSPPSVYTYSATADIGTISSSSASDTVDVEIIGLDASFIEVTQTVTLTGQVDVLLPTNLIRSFRILNVGSTDLVGVVYLRTNGSAQSGGVPTVANTVRAIVNNGNNITLMAVYTVPAGVTGYMRDWYSSIGGANKTSNYKLKIRARPFGQVFRLVHTRAISDNGTSSVQHLFEEPEVFGEKTDIEITVRALAVGVTGASIDAGFDIVLVDN